MFWDKANFGDALSPYIVNRLSGRKIIKKDLYHGFIFAVRCLYGYSRRRMFHRLSFATWPWEKNLMAVGSILQFANPKSEVWGSGFMGSEEKYVGVGKIHAVRGPLSSARIKQLSGIECDIYGDPAILLPLLRQPASTKGYDIGIIPHMIEADFFIKEYSTLKDGTTIPIIDLRTYNINEVIQQITSCRMILSTSLHGIIVSHAYRIPAIWIQNNLKDSDFKFRDYFTSVGIEPYKGFANIADILASKKDIVQFFVNNRNLSLPHFDIQNMQRDLLKVAPFKLLEKYQKLI